MVTEGLRVGNLTGITKVITHNKISFIACNVNYKCLIMGSAEKRL